MNRHVKMSRLMLAATTAMMMPLMAHAAMDDEGVYIQPSDQQTYLGSAPSMNTTTTTRAIPVEGQNGTLVERSVTTDPPVSTYGYAAPAPASVPESQLDAMAPATSGEPRPARTPVNDELLAEHTVNNIAFVTGGIGEAERQAMETLRPKYNLRVTNSEKSGAFVSDTVVSLLDSKGAELLSTPTEPMFLANLPAGRYTVKAERNGQVKTQAVTISKGKSAQVQFGWM